MSQPQPSPKSLVARVLGAFRSPGASFAYERSFGLEERRLIAFAFGATLFLTLGRVLAETARPELALGPERSAWFTATVFAGFSFGVLGLYAMAAIARLAARVFGGKGGWADTRLALFWSGFAAGPLIALGNIAGALVDGRSLGALAGGAIWACLFAPMLAAAHGFRPWVVFIILVITCGLLLTAPRLI